MTSELRVCSVYDSKAGVYGRPLFFETTADALRSFREAVNQSGGDDRNTIAKYPADFVMFDLGVFDRLTGKFECHVAPFSLAVGTDLLDRPAVPADVVK